MTERWREHQRSCRHFTGIQNPTCGMNIPYSNFPPGGRPCIPAHNKTESTCPHFELLTDEEAQVLETKIQEGGLAYLKAMMAGVCHECGAVIEHEEQVGRSVYARPCGHRQFQGRARSKERLAALREKARE